MDFNPNIIFDAGFACPDFNNTHNRRHFPTQKDFLSDRDPLAQIECAILRSALEPLRSNQTDRIRERNGYGRIIFSAPGIIPGARAR
jgi:hypothetical protein